MDQEAQGRAGGITPPSTVESVGYVFEAPAGPVLRAVTRLAGAATVVGVRAFRAGGTGATVNARADADTLLPVDLSVATADTWMSAPSLQNTAVAAGTSLQVEVAEVTGAVSYVVVRIDYQSAPVTPPAAVFDFETVVAAPGVEALRVLVDGEEAAYLTHGAKTVTVQGPPRTFSEAKKVGPRYREDFGRVRTLGWGLSPFYGSWSSNAGGVPADYPVDGTAGKIHPTATGTSFYQTLRDDVVDADVRIRVRVSTSPAGAANSVSILTGYTTTGNHDRARVTFNSTGSLTATLASVSGGTETTLASQGSVITGYTGGTWIWARVRRDGPTSNMWVWADGAPEPQVPTVTATSTANLVGRVGLRAFNSAGATNDPTYEIDELQITAGRWPSPPDVTHRTWVRLLPEPFTAWTPAVEAMVRGWLVDTTPDVLAYSMMFIAGAPAAVDPRLFTTGVDAPKQVLGEARYGPTEADGTRQEGSDFNDYIRISWSYPNTAVPTTDVNEVAQRYCLDCSGFLRMIFGYHLRLPMSLQDRADLNGVNLPRRAVQIGPNGPGVLIAESTGVPVDTGGIRVGDIVTFNADSGDDLAGAKAGEVAETDDHIGLYLGVDGDGNKVFHSSRKITNGPTFGPLGGVSHLNGSGFWALAARRVRRF